MGQFTEAVEVDRQRFGGADHARDAGDVAERIEASRQRLNDLGHALGRADIGLDEGVERPRRRVDVDADNVGAEREREFADPRADAGRDSGDDDGLAKQHLSLLPHLRRRQFLRIRLRVRRSLPAKAVSDRQQPERRRVLDPAPQAAREKQGENERRRAEADQIPDAHIAEPGLDREEDDGAEDRALERSEAADQRHEDHVGRP